MASTKYRCVSLKWEWLGLVAIYKMATKFRDEPRARHCLNNKSTEYSDILHDELYCGVYTSNVNVKR